VAHDVSDTAINVEIVLSAGNTDLNGVWLEIRSGEAILNSPGDLS
jgi:hypothetical protein